MKIIYIVLGFLFFGLGAVGAFLPVLPTVPFLLLASFFFAKGSERFHRWFLSTGLYKKHLESFAESREMTIKTKAVILSVASCMLALAFYFAPHIHVRILIVVLIVLKYYYFIFRVKTKKTDPGSDPGDEKDAEPEQGKEEEKEQEAGTGAYKKKLIFLAGNARKYIALTVFTNWINLLCSIVAVTVIAMVLEGAAERQSVARQGYLVLGVIGAAIAVRFFSSRLAVRFSHKAAVAAQKQLRSGIYEKLLRIGPDYGEKASAASVVQTSVEGVEQLQAYFGSYLPQLYYSVLAPATLFVFFSVISLKAALILILFVPLIPATIFVIQKYARKMNGNYWITYTSLGETFLESLHGLTTLKIYGADERRSEEMNASAEGFRKATMKVLRMQLNSISVMDLIAYGGAAAGILTGLWELSSGRVPLWGAVCILLLSSEFFIPLRMLGSLFHVSMNGVAAGEKIFALMDLPEEEARTGELAASDIEVQGLSFSYREDRTILNDISMKLTAGGFLSVVGESGSGKSTLAGILSGMIRHYEGSVRIGGKELKDVSRASIMRNITVVENNGYIFKGTVEENLRMGNPRAAERDMLDALVKVGLYDFVMSQGGLSMEIKEQGANLSGGQRQRLSLARALLHDSSIYIFDEATSNIDMESEENIMEVIRSLKGEKTVILITHRLSSAARADTVCFLKEGRIEGWGSHRAVYERCGHYAGLYDSQQKIENFQQGGMVYA